MQQELQLKSNCKRKDVSKFKLEKELQLESNYAKRLVSKFKLEKVCTLNFDPDNAP